jgi:hypothetical protein
MSTDHFVTRLVGRPAVTRWVRFLSVASSGSEQPGPDALEVLKSQHRDILGELSNFYNYDLVGKKVQYISTPINSSTAIGFARRIYHQIRFIDRKIFRLSQKHREAVIRLFDSILDYLAECPPTTNGMYASLPKEELLEYALSPPKVWILRRYAEFRRGLVAAFRPLTLTEEELRQDLIQVIEVVGRGVDARTSFYRHTPLQNTFERFFLSEKFWFRKGFGELVQAFPADDPPEFLASVFAFVVQCLTELRMNSKPNDASLVLLVIRALFDRVYDKNPFFMEPEDDVVGRLADITLKELAPPAEFLPPFEDNTKVVDLFRGDPLFSESIACIEMVVFQTNGFDILDCVEKALTQIERAAFHYNKGATIVFPFEVTFALFLGVVLSSQIRNWGNIANFVEAYTPVSGLCPAFEFSRAKVVASLMQFRQMLAERKTGQVL